MSAPGADASAAAAPEGAPAPGKKKKLGKKERQRLKAIADGTYVAPVLPQKQPPKAKQARQPYNGGMAPSLLTKYIKEAWTTTALLETCEQYQDRMNKIHASASWNCLGRLATAAADARWFDRDRRALEALARKTTEMVLASVDVRSEPAEDASANAVMGARELANVAHGLAKCGAAHASDEPGETFFDHPAVDARWRRDALPDVSKKHTVDDATHRADDRSNTTDPLRALVDALAAALTARARECNAQEAANAAWAFRKLGREGDPALYSALAFVARREAEKDAMNPQELVNAAWAFSGVLAAETETKEKNDVANDVAFAEEHLARTVDALAASAAKRLRDFDARGVCVLTCALAKAKRAVSRFHHGIFMPRKKNDALGGVCDGGGGSALSLLAKETEARVARVSEGFDETRRDAATFYFSARDVAASSWAFASLDFFDESLFVTLASASVAMCARGAFDARALANVAWAHAKANVGGDEAGRRKLFQSVAGALTDACADETFFKSSANVDKEMSSRDIANSAWAFAKACFPDDALFDALRLCAVRRDPGLEKFNNQDLVNAFWAYAKLAARGAGALFRAARATVAARADADAFTAANITTLVWAMHSAQGLEGLETTERTKEKENEIPFSAVSEALARAAARACAASEPAELAATAWTFADAVFRDTSDASRAVPSRAHKDLFRTLGSRVRAILDSNATDDFKERESFGDEELDNLEWAFSKAGDPGNVLRRVKAARRRHGDAFASLGGSGLSGLGARLFDPSADPSSAIRDGGSRDAPRGAKDEDENETENENASCGRVVVAGGGIGGAAAALALQRSGFDVVVLESDAAFDARKQGYGLTVQGTDLRDGLGIDLTADDAPSTSHYTFKQDGTVLGFFGEAFGTGGEKSEKKASSKASARFAHVPRQIMRLRMLERLKPGTVRWGSRLRSFELRGRNVAEENADEETKKNDASNDDDAAAASRRAVRVTLEDGSVIDACLLVGSDGIHSTTRRLLRLKGETFSISSNKAKGDAKKGENASDPDTLAFVGLAVVLGIVDDQTFLSTRRRRVLKRGPRADLRHAVRDHEHHGSCRSRARRRARAYAKTRSR